jgi:hypothetical protein
MAGLIHALTAVFPSDFPGQDRQGPLQRARECVELVLIGDVTVTPRHLLEAGGDPSDLDRADIEAHRFEGMGQRATRLGLPGFRVLAQLGTGLRRMLGIEVHHALEEVTLLCLIQRPQLPQGGGIDERQVGVPVRVGRSDFDLVLDRAAIIHPRKLARRYLELRHQIHQTLRELRDRERLVDDRVHAGEPPLFGRRANDVRGQGDNRNTVTVFRCFRLPDDAGGREAIHLRHAAVHQDDVMRMPGGGADRLNAALGRLDSGSQSGQRLDGDLAIDRAVVGDQHPEVGESGQRPVTSRPGRPPLQLLVSGSDAAQQFLDFRTQQRAADRGIGRAILDDGVGRGIAEPCHRHPDGNSV